MSDPTRIKELRKEIESLCGNCDRPDKEELGKIIISSMALGFSYGMEADRPLEWIPCSERLPSKPKNYPYCEIRRTYYLVSLESGCVKTLGYEFDRDEWQYTASRVLAWMPLPEPWKGADDE